MQVIKHKTFINHENWIPYGIVLMDRLRKREERKTPRCVCTSYEKTRHLGFAYILFKTWSSRHLRRWKTLSNDLPMNPLGNPQPISQGRFPPLYMPWAPSFNYYINKPKMYCFLITCTHTSWCFLSFSLSFVDPSKQPHKGFDFHRSNKFCV